MVDVVSGLVVLFANCWSHMKLLGNHDVISEDTGFEDHRSILKWRVIVIVSLIDNHMAVKFMLINYNDPYNGILGIIG